MVDPVGREPEAFLKREGRSGLALDRRRDLFERDVVPASQRGRQDADDPPVIGAAHRKEEMEASAPEIDVDLSGHHGSGHHRVGDIEDVLIRRALELDAVQLPHRAAGAVAAGEPGEGRLPNLPVRMPDPGDHAIAFLRQCDELGPPLDIQPVSPQRFAEETLVVVLSQDQDVRIRAHVASRLPERNPGHAAGAGPHLAARGGRAELQRTVGDLQVPVDLQGARLDSESPGLHGGTVVPVDDSRAHTAPGELVGEHQPGRPRAHDQDARVHGIAPLA